jgi:hypothetical protein
MTPDENMAAIRTSSRKAAGLMLFSGCVVLFSLLYSFLQIRRLDGQIATRKIAVSLADKEISLLKKEISERQATKLKLEQDIVQLQAEVGGLRATLRLVPGKQLQNALEAAPPRLTANLPPRVYIHIANEDQSRLANLASSKLESAGYVVPGIEYVGNNAPNATQIRYFQPDEQDGQDLKGIVQILSQAGISASVQYIYASPSSKLRPRHFELYFGRNVEKNSAR